MIGHQLGDERSLRPAGAVRQRSRSNATLCDKVWRGPAGAWPWFLEKKVKVETASGPSAGCEV